MKLKFDLDIRSQYDAEVTEGVTSLDLSHNNLGARTLTELIQAFSAIPPQVTSLNLSCNKLGALSRNDLHEIFKLLRRTLVAINLSDNNLNAHRKGEFYSILGGFSKLDRLILLDLRGNGLEFYSRDVVTLSGRAVIMDSGSTGIPVSPATEATATATATATIEATSAVPIQLLFTHHLSRSTTDMKALLQLLPDDITFIDLRCNDLRDLNSEQWLSFLNAIPATVSRVRADYKSQQIIRDILYQLRTQAFYLILSRMRDTLPVLVDMILEFAVDASDWAIETVMQDLLLDYNTSVYSPPGVNLEVYTVDYPYKTSGITIYTPAWFAARADGTNQVSHGVTPPAPKLPTTAVTSAVSSHMFWNNSLPPTSETTPPSQGFILR